MTNIISTNTISLKSITEGSNRITDIKANFLGIFYLENRPKELGRSVLIHAFKPVGSDEYRHFDLTDRQTSVRSSVHEYGGAAFFVSDESIYFINARDQQIYKVTIYPNHKINSGPTKITDNAHSRFADIDINQDTGLIVAIMEVHNEKGVDNMVVAANLNTVGKYLKWNPVETDHDFCSTPRISPDGRHISYLVWDQPNMPWDRTFWKVAEISINLKAIEVKQRFYIKPRPSSSNYSVINTQFLDDQTLFGISDSRNGYLNPVTASLGNRFFENLAVKRAEFGWPHWVFGRNMIVKIPDDDSYLGAYFNGEKWTLCLIGKNSITDIKSDLINISTITSFQSPKNKLNSCNSIYVLGSTATKQSEVYEVILKTPITNKVKPLNLKPTVDFDKKFFSNPRLITINGAGDDELNFIYHRPKLSALNSETGKRIKPVIIQMHGGPTSMAEPGCNLIAAFFNNLSIGVAEVNYRGSSGFGRKFLQSLYGNWGVYDSQDAFRVASYLVDNNLATSGQVGIRGSSAGGYSVLMSIAKYDIFNAAVSYYGIADLKMLAKDTHKFEAKYLDKLVGNQKSDSKKYMDRSPINLASSIKSPLLIFQGGLDPIVPKNQAQLIYEALRQNKIKTKLVVFEGESHGFRMSRTTKKCLLAEVKFYSEVFGYDFGKQLK